MALAFAVLALSIVLRPYPAERLGRTPIESSEIVDRNGQRLHEVRSELGGYGRWVALSEISPELVALTLSSEDAGFRDHAGIDPIGVARALWLNIERGRIAFGGSTVTQQLAGMLEPRPRTLLGKLAEADAALRLERTLDKDQILEQYLNRAYYGRLAYGVEAAAQRFFGKPARELELDQAALLAILPRAPSAYDAERNPERALARRAHVLRRAAERGVIERSRAERAAKAPIRLVQHAAEPRARHVLDALGARPPGRVVTTIDLELQTRIEARVRAQLRDLAERDVDQAGVIVLDNDSGELLAMVGSRRYDEQSVAGAVNVTLARRPAGSTLKPFVYALELERGKNPASPVYDVPTSWPGFVPRNSSLDHAGRVSLRVALASSLNVPAVRALASVGLAPMSELFGELDLVESDVEEHGLALALGSAPVRLVDLANAYATLARGGVHRPWRMVSGPAGPSRRVFSAETAFLVTDMLADAGARRLEFGVETPLELPFAAAVKTGTSKSFCDNVVVGFTRELTVAVWVGNFDGRPMHSLLAMQGAAPLWRDVMLLAADGRVRRGFEPPPGIETRELCPLSGLLRGPDCPAGRHEHVATRHAPARSCDWHGAAGALRSPPELVSSGETRDVVPNGTALAIASPADGTRFRIDPLVPRSRQRLRLSALVGAPDADRVRWQIDDRLVAEVSAPFAAFWTIEPGAHRVRAIAISHEKTGSPREIARHEARIEVDGGTR